MPRRSDGLNAFLAFLLFFQFGNVRVNDGVEFGFLLGYVCVHSHPRKFGSAQQWGDGACMLATHRSGDDWLGMVCGDRSSRQALFREPLQCRLSAMTQIFVASTHRLGTIRRSIRNDSETGLATWQWRAKVPLIGNESSR
jgi:hypothetical protein